MLSARRVATALLLGRPGHRGVPRLPRRCWGGERLLPGGSEHGAPLLGPWKARTADCRCGPWAPAVTDSSCPSHQQGSAVRRQGPSPRGGSDPLGVYSRSPCGCVPGRGRLAAELVSSRSCPVISANLGHRSGDSVARGQAERAPSASSGGGGGEGALVCSVTVTAQVAPWAPPYVLSPRRPEHCG